MKRKLFILSFLFFSFVEQFKNQYEAGAFPTAEKFSAPRVFRDDREYEEYLKTIYKTEDSK